MLCVVQYSNYNWCYLTGGSCYITKTTTHASLVDTPFSLLFFSIKNIEQTNNPPGGTPF